MEQKEIYLEREDTNGRYLSQSFTIQIKHVAMVSDLVARGVGKNASDVVRMAIEAFYKQQEAVEA